MSGRSAVHPRTKERKRALEILYAADLRGRPVVEAVDEDPALSESCREFVEGVAAHADEIDALIRQLADRWTLERMPVLDRNLLRVGIFELLFARRAPDAVIINEMVELAKLLSTEDSGRFINGILGRVVRERTGTT